jgi:CubicO group peptidase (beta-lactamase class C family)
MTLNHVPHQFLPYKVGGIYSPGYGFGLGLRVLLDVGQCGTLGSPGESGWGGAATTYFWIDPQEELIAILMAQFMPPGCHLLDADFRVLAYQAIAD